MPDSAPSPTAATCLTELAQVLVAMQALAPAIDAAGDRLLGVLRAGGKVLTAGNGGSAADALHLAEELVGRFDRERPSLPAVSLCADPTLLTCIGNDYGFDAIFARQVEGLGRPGDALVVFTSSGNSANLLSSLRAARAKGLVTVALLGKDGGAARGLAEHELIVPSRTTARIQEVHTLILHAWLTRIETALLGKP